MSLWNWIRTKTLGVDLEEEQRIGAEQDAKIKAYQDQKLADQEWTPAQYETAQEHWVAGQTGDVVAQVDQAFEEGWDEGKDNISSGIKGTLNKVVADPIKALLGGLPWWLWLGAGLAVFFYFGGAGWLKKQMEKR